LCLGIGSERLGVLGVSSPQTLEKGGKLKLIGMLVLAATLQYTPIEELTLQYVPEAGVAEACGRKADDPDHAGSVGCATLFEKRCHTLCAMI
jgi:hypothetical protein